MTKLLLLFLLGTFLVLETKAQWGWGGAVSVGRSCMSTTQCTGAAICMQSICQCPTPLYLAVGGTCIMRQTIQTTRVTVNPGMPCGGGMSVCGGGSACIQNSCACPQGMMISGSSCTTMSVRPMAPMPMAPIGCPTGMVMFRSQCVPTAVITQPALGCGGGCGGGAVCMQNACQCGPGLMYSAGSCTAIRVSAMQALPGMGCTVGVECTGGSMCLMGRCCCPPGLAQAGTVCVIPQVGMMTTTRVVVGAGCVSTNQCGFGAVCSMGRCGCQSTSFVQMGSMCVRRRFAGQFKAKKEAKKEEVQNE